MFSFLVEKSFTEPNRKYKKKKGEEFLRKKIENGEFDLIFDYHVIREQ